MGDPQASKYNISALSDKRLKYLTSTLLPWIMVGEMVQNSQSLHSFTFNAVIVIHEYIYSHSTTEFTFKKYLYECE